jgi:FkbM family methyltransferase
MKPLPFKMRTVTEMEKYRHDTFWTKEPETLAWISGFGPHDAFFDVGANIGLYSLYCASLFQGMRVYAFEPMPANFGQLVKNIRLNDFRNTRLYPWAVGIERGFVRLNIDIPDDEAGKSGAQIAERGVRVMGVRLDYFKDELEGKSINVKIDIDGQELNVIKGMRLILPSVKSILVEVSRKSKAEIEKTLTFSGFTTHNRFNTMTPHSRERRAKEGIDAENIVFTR